MNEPASLKELGWQPFFQQQLSIEEWDSVTPARVVEQHKSKIEIISERGQQSLPITSSTPTLTVGDWVLTGMTTSRCMKLSI